MGETFPKPKTWKRFLLIPLEMKKFNTEFARTSETDLLTLSVPYYQFVGPPSMYYSEPENALYFLPICCDRPISETNRKIKTVLKMTCIFPYINNKR